MLTEPARAQERPTVIQAATLLDGKGGMMRNVSIVVQGTRSAFQAAMKHKFIAAVECLSGREVLSFTSNHRVGPDMEVEIFMLEPAPCGAAEPAAV